MSYLKETNFCGYLILWIAGLEKFRGNLMFSVYKKIITFLLSYAVDAFNVTHPLDVYN